MLYLTARDYKTYIKNEHLKVISDDDLDSVLNAEIASKEEMSSYLANRYAVELIFIKTPEFAEGDNYTVGEQVFFMNQVYTCIADTTEAPLVFEDPLDEESDLVLSEDWELKDQRNKVIMMYLCDITIYHLHASINPRNIPELRGIRYDRAVQWLRDVSRLIINPELPLVGQEEPERVKQIRYGSNPKRNLRY